MSNLSRNSFSPWARTGRWSRSAIADSAVRKWLARHLVVGGLLGILASASHFVVRRLHGDGPESWKAELGGALLTSAVFGLLTATTGAIAGALARRAWGRLLGATLLGGWVASFVVVHGVAEGFFLAGGSELSLGAVEFFANGLEHLALPLLRDNLSSLVALGVIGVTLGFVAACWAWREAPASLAPGRLCAAAMPLGLTLAGAALVVSSPEFVGHRAYGASPQLAFVASALERNELLAEAEDDGRVVPQPGLSLETGRVWERATRAAKGPRPNVLITILESVDIDHLGYLGHRRPDGTSVTPELDRIAKRSVRFRQARTTATHSNYAQMAVLSSLFPRRYSGLDTYGRLDYPRVLWHDVLDAAGYETATQSSQDETWQGMLRFQSTETRTTFHHAGNHEGHLIDTGTEHVVPDRITAERAIAWIGDRDGPWALYVNFQATHFPYKLPAQAAKPYSPWRPKPRTFQYLSYPFEERETVLNKYHNALHYVDAQVGRIRRHLEENGELRDTLWIITSDHGELFHEHGMVTHGRSLYDAEARVPLLVHWPKRLAPGDVERPVSHLDILPTLASLLELAPHPAFQGQDLFEPEDPERAIFMNIQGMRSQDGVLCWPYKLISDRSGGGLSLFDLEKDPDESNNLVAKKPRVASALDAVLRAQMRSQLRYHAPGDDSERSARYAPRLLDCPSSNAGSGERVSTLE